MIAHYRPSLRQDGFYEIFLYPDDPAYKVAEEHLERRSFAPLSAGFSFVGTAEEYFRFGLAMGILKGQDRYLWALRAIQTTYGPHVTAMQKIRDIARDALEGTQ